MTVTRKQRDEIQPITQEELGGLVLKSQEPTEISRPLPQGLPEAIEWLRENGAPEWNIVLLQMAQDKRHDIAPHTVDWWRDKLSGVSDSVICRALRRGTWQYFPSVDDVLEMCELVQEQDRQEAMEREWVGYKQKQQYAEENGLLATEEDYAYMRRRVRELFGDPNAKQTGNDPGSKAGNGK